MTKISALTPLGDNLAVGDQFIIRDIDDAGTPNKSVTISGITRGLEVGTALAPSIAFAADKNTGVYGTGSDVLALVTAGTNRLHITSGGLVGIGTTSVDAKLHIQGVSGTYPTSILNHSAIDVEGEVIRIGRTDSAVRYHSIYGQQSATHSSNYLQFRVHEGSAYPFTSQSTVMTLTGQGRVGIGTTSPGSALEINAAAATSPFIAKINTAEAARIDSSGWLLVGTTTVFSGSGITPKVTIDASIITGTSGTGLGINGISSNEQALATRPGANHNYNPGFFMNSSGTGIGSIACTSSATAFNTSSDYRLKENVTAVTNGITRLQQLKPSRFNFVVDPDTVVDGFIAHEAQAVVPECVTGTKDEVDEDGNPVYQGIDQSKLVPLLTAALQEAIGEIESLKARLTAAGI